MLVCLCACVLVCVCPFVSMCLKLIFCCLNIQRAEEEAVKAKRLAAEEAKNKAEAERLAKEEVCTYSCVYCVFCVLMPLMGALFYVCARFVCCLRVYVCVRACV